MIELTINESLKQSLAVLTAEKYDYYLFSVYIWNSQYLEELIPLLKKLCPDSIIAAGGPEISYNLKKWESFHSIDILVCGQAEDFAENMLSCSERVYYSKHTEINKVPFPYDKEDYPALENRLVYYESSRGCLFNCSYCLSSCQGQQLEYRNPDSVKKDLKQLIDMKPKVVKMVDRTFNSKRDFAREIWKFLIEEKSPVPFHFELHPLFLEEEDFALLATAPPNLFQFEVGIQSTDKKVLEAVNRPWNWPRERDNIKKLCSLKNIHTHLDQIVGLPEDTKTTGIRSFNNILSFRPDEFQLGFLKILPGTALSEKTGDYSMAVRSAPPYEVFQTSTLPFNEIKEFYRVEADLNRYYNSHYFVHSISYFLEKTGSPWTFFSGLQKFSPDNSLSKQWAVLGESLIRFSETHLKEDREYIKDLLRLDWCPFSSGQNFPPFLRRESDSDIKNLRRELYPYFEKTINGFTRREYNRSILFLPESERMKETKPRAVLFYRREGGGVERYHAE